MPNTYWGELTVKYLWNFGIKKSFLTLIMFFLILSISSEIMADTPVPPDAMRWNPARPDGHPPIGVMGDHTHNKGGFMFSYRYKYMDMNGNRIGTKKVSNQKVLEDFMVTPTDMTMQMHMFGLMYAPLDYVTLMGMLRYVKKSMKHLTRIGTRFKTESDGIGDIKFTGLVKVYDDHDQRFHVNLGLSFPTGSIDEKDATPMGPNQQLPYPMQLGSGTFDLLPGVTYLGQHDYLSWGSQVSGVIRLGENDRDFTLGNALDMTAWGHGTGTTGSVLPVDWTGSSGEIYLERTRL